MAPDLLGERAAGLPLHHASARTLPQLRPGRSAAASTLGRRCAARWASPSAPAGRWPRADCGDDPHPRGLMPSVGTMGAARGKDRSRPHLPTGRCWVSGRALNLRPDVRPSRAPAPALTYGGGGKGSSDPTSGDGELLGPHAPSALLELSSLDPGLGARAQDDGRAASIARGPCRTRTEERSGCITRQCWSSRLSRLGVCEGTPMYVCMYVCFFTYNLRT